VNVVLPHAAHLRAFRARVVERGDRVRDRVVTGGVDELAHHDLHAPGHAGDAERVVADRADDAGHVGAVAPVVVRIAAAIQD
jgi:hypothetical protein